MAIPLIALIAAALTVGAAEPVEVRLQLGAYLDRSRAEAHLTRLSRGVLGPNDGLRLVLEGRARPPQVGTAARTLYYVYLTGFTNARQARGYCDYIEGFGQQCLVIIRPIHRPDLLDE